MGKGTIFRAIVAVLSAIATATGLTLDAIQVTGIDMKWWTLIAFVIFCIFVVLMLLDSNNKNKKLENNLPSIIVTLCRSFDNIYLKIFNEGERATFKAHLDIMSLDTGNSEADFLARSLGYSGLWTVTNTDKAEIVHGDADSISIASIINMQSLKLHYYDTAVHESRTLECLMQKSPDKNIIGPSVHLKINISSYPSLRESHHVRDGTFTRNYVVSPDGIVEDKLQPLKLKGIRVELVEQRAFNTREEYEAWEKRWEKQENQIAEQGATNCSCRKLSASKSSVIVALNKLRFSKLLNCHWNSSK